MTMTITMTMIVTITMTIIITITVIPVHHHYAHHCCTVRANMATQEKFKGVKDKDVHKVISYFVYYRFFNPAIVAPEGYDIVTTLLNNVARKNLAQVRFIIMMTITIITITTSSSSPPSPPS